MKLNNEKGIALIFTMVFAVIMYALSGIFIIRAYSEKRMAQLEREQAKAFFASQGGAQAALEQLDTLINDYLTNTIASANPSGVISFANQQVNQSDGIDWLLSAVRDNNTPVLIDNEDQAEFADTDTLGNVTFNYNIIITEKSDPTTVGPDAWDFPFNYKIETSSASGNVNSIVTLLGDFTVRVQRDNFAKYALFTNEQETPGGSNVWFTDKTNFAGPVHTNERFNFALNPSGTFEQAVSQEEQTARFYNGGWTVLLDADYNGTDDVPTFNNTFERDAEAISLSAAVGEQDMIDQAQGSGGNFNNDGIYVPANENTLKAGIFVKGDSAISMGVDGSNNPVYTINQGGITKSITIDKVNDQTIVYDQSTSTQTSYSGLPDGTDDVGTLIYVDGNITSFSGTVQSDEQVTISSSSDIVINDHVRYETFTAGSGTPGTAGYTPPSVSNNDGNLLGIVSWGGDVRIGTSAPNEVDVHGTILASNGIFTVDNYNDQGVGARGTATLLGGVISDNYGAFGLFNGSTGTQLSGYGRNFVYDERMQAGAVPPYFPSLNTFVAFTNDIMDKMVWQEGE